MFFRSPQLLPLLSVFLWCDFVINCSLKEICSLIVDKENQELHVKRVISPLLSHCARAPQEIERHASSFLIVLDHKSKYARKKQREKKREKANL